jgi:hypothetical protein
MPVSDWSESAALNTSVAGINIAPGCPRANIDDALRAIMAEAKAGFIGTHDILTGEVGAINLQYEVGDSRRYGVFPDGITNWEGTTSYLTNMLKTALAGHKLYFRKNGADYFYKTGWNWTNRHGYSGISIEIEDGVEFGGIWHLISSGAPANRVVPTAVSVGTTTTITVATGHGMTVGDVHYVTFTGMGMAALDGLDVVCTPTSSTQFTVAANTTGQVWSATGECRDVAIRNVTIRGTLTTYDRFGAIFCQGLTMDKVICKSDATKSTVSLQGRGVHIYYGCSDWNIGEIVVEDFGPQSESPTNHAAVAFDGDTREPRNINIGRIWVKDSQASGVVLKGAGFDVGQIVVDAYGRGVISVAPEGVSGTDSIGYAASTRAAAVWLVRGTGKIGAIRFGQKNGYASGRSFASYGVAIEGALLEWSSSVSFTNMRKGWDIGHIEVRDAKAIALSLGAFGQAAYANVGRVDLGKIVSTNDMVTDAGVQLAAGQVWVSHGKLTYGQITAKDLNLACGLRVDSNTDATAVGQGVTVETHQGRAVWFRGHGDPGFVEILDRTGTDANWSITVDGGASSGANLRGAWGRNPSGATGGFLNFSPVRGSLGAIDVQDYVGTSGSNSAVRLGDNTANRVMVTQGGSVRKTAPIAGTGLVIDGIVDSQASGLRVEGFTLGVHAAGASTRLTSFGNVITGNTTNTDLPDAQLMTSSKLAATNNTNWSV